MNEKQPVRTLVIDALNCEQLRYSLVDVIGIDDGDGTLEGRKKPQEYTDAEIIAEAEYQLSCYFEIGHIHNEMLMGEHENPNNYESPRKTAKREVKELKSFLKKHK